MRRAPPQRDIGSRRRRRKPGHEVGQRRRRELRRLGASASKHIVLIALSAMFGLPLIWMVGTSFKTAQQALALPVSGGRTRSCGPTTRSCSRRCRIFRFFLNTFLYAAVTIVGVLHLEQPGRLRLLPAQVAGPGRPLLRDADDADPAVRLHADPAVRHVQALRLDRRLPAAGGADVLRQLGVQHVPAPPVLHDDPAVAVGSGAHRRGERVLHLPPDHPAAGEARHGDRDPVPVHLLLERLPGPADLHQQPELVPALARAWP